MYGIYGIEPRRHRRPARHGRQLLHEDGHAALDEEFDLTDYLLEQWEADFAAWFAEPHYSVRPELIKWLKADA